MNRILTFLSGWFICLVFLMSIGETGGQHLRKTLNAERAAHTDYQAQCEASLGDALKSLERANVILKERLGEP